MKGNGSMREKLKEKGDELFLCFFLPLVGVMSIGKGSLWPLYKYVFVACMLFGILKIYATDYTKAEWYSFLVIIGFLGANCIHNGERKLLLTVIALFALKSVDLAKVIKLSLILRSCLVFMTMIFAKIGIIENTMTELPKHGEFVWLYNYGYTHPNHAILYILTICILTIMAYVDKNEASVIRWGIYAVLSGIMYGAYCLFMGRSALGCWIILLVMIVLYETNKKTRFKTAYLKMLCLVPFVCLIFTLAGVYLQLAGHPIGILLNNIMTGRLSMFCEQVSNLKEAIFWGYETRGFPDLGYAALIYHYGWIFAIGCICFYSYVMWMFAEQGRGYAVCILAVMAVYFLMEEMPTNIVINISLIYLAEYIWKYRSGRKMMKECETPFLKSS